AYHGEGIWLMDPALFRHGETAQEVATVTEHARILRTPWINLECASKAIASYQFGTYLPPPFTPEMADLVARNASALQERLRPLLLLELPPLTYFGYGILSPALFFRRIAQQAPCGFVLDIGHMWTQWRYGAEGVPLQEWLQAFLRDFPLERVVEIHIAGLALHPGDDENLYDDPPRWLDAHPATIPEVLFEMLDVVLPQPRLSSLRGAALEVDGKDIDTIVREFGDFRNRFGRRVDAVIGGPFNAAAEHVSSPDMAVTDGVGASLRRYAETVIGARPIVSGSGWYGDLARYRRIYLPHEILVWGGELNAMFPETCRALDRHDVSLAEFVAWWFQQPRADLQSYDFFLLKLDRFVAFVTDRLSELRAIAVDEAELLRSGYLEACDHIGDEVRV
ncbi:MAG TPA: DUF692 family protein, partial [Nitrospirales bacterium]|nr:DUF692 family protein [Nitrospirales bacterium]